MNWVALLSKNACHHETELVNKLNTSRCDTNLSPEILYSHLIAERVLEKCALNHGKVTPPRLSNQAFESLWYSSND